MALDFSGIDNVEFYSGHYLSAVLEGDLKALFQKWKEAKDQDGKRLPREALAGLANRYFAAYSKAVEERDPAERLQLAQSFHAHLLEALGYRRKHGVEPIGDDEVVPVHLALRRDGRPFLWVIEAPFPLEEEEAPDPLNSPPLPEQLGSDGDSVTLPKSQESKRKPASWREILDDRLFRIDRPPRWVLFLSGSEVLLIERYKWPQGRYLRFDLGELLGRKQSAALQAMAGLLHRDVLAPDSGLCLHDTLDENSHKHAYAVSGDLKHGVRRSVELLANEAVYYRREVQKQGVFGDEAFAGKLTSECLTWLYRLLFLFYVEARGKDVGAVPMDSDTYRKGYSLEGLRDLELVPLTTEHARNGFFIHESLQKLFRILNMGFPRLDPESPQSGIRLTKAGEMQVDALNSPLFDDDRLEVLKGVRFRNSVLQEVLQLLSLSAEKKRRLRGRISYAQLGINQLGAVYEGLLSYTGFFASEDLYEVAAEKECKALSGRPAAEREALKTYFVPASQIGEYKESEIVKDENGKKFIHKKGTFIFRLAGRNREKSASYYTPEVLTHCLVKYALKELLYDEDGNCAKTGAQILDLTVCEPAMGSASFLIEAVDQLADAYLTVRQQELEKTILPEQYQAEKRRVMARLATNNCYGVDLNPTAVELGKVSLWLATLHEEGKCPWFGLRLATGNSLVGARREVFKTRDVTRRGSKENPNWLDLAPTAVPFHASSEFPGKDSAHQRPWTLPPRPKGTIYHFLLPAEGMAAFDTDKVIKTLVPDEIKHIKAWRKEFCKPLRKDEADRLEKVSDAVDRLLAQVVRERTLATQETSDRIPVWGEDRPPVISDLLVRDQEAVASILESQSSAYRRLKLAMDAWCALWFWPLEKAKLLPDRATWLAQLELILIGEMGGELPSEQQDLFAALTPPAPKTTPPAEEKAAPDGEADLAQAESTPSRLARLKKLSDEFKRQRADYQDECGLANIESILRQDSSLRTAQAICDQLRFHHWPLRFAEVFAQRGGFDLIVGNPPWILLSFDEGGVLGDYDPSIVIRKRSAADIARLRKELLKEPVIRDTYLTEYVVQVGSQSFLGDPQNYLLLVGMKSNLYKCFITRAWENGSSSGVAAFLHPEGVYDDPKGGALRAALYPRLAGHYQFVNEALLFSEVSNHAKYSINIYHTCRTRPVFHHMSNLFHPRTIDASWAHDGLGAVPSIKNEDDHFDASGHRNRLIAVDEDRLALFASLYDEPGTPPSGARLPVVHSEEIVRVLQRFAEQPRKLGDLEGEYFATQHWNETNAQKDGTIRHEARYPKDASEWILQGPHFYVGTPFNKTPNEGCSTNRDYTAIDLTAIPDDYLPRTNYVPACDPAEYARRTPKWKGRPVTEYYRMVNRELVSPTGERTLVSCIAPPGAGHIHAVFGTAASSTALLTNMAAMAASLPLDFIVKSTGKGHVNKNLIAIYPIPQDRGVCDLLSLRVLRLSCLTQDYADLWEDLPGKLESSVWDDQRLQRTRTASARWTRDVAWRTDLDRRYALVEIDVLAGMGLGLTLGELTTIYRAQFPVLQQYERERLYDQLGRVVPTSKTAAGEPAICLPELAAVLKQQCGFDTREEYSPDRPTAGQILGKEVRLGRREADVLGVSERCTMADLLAETEVRWYDDDHPEGRTVRLLGIRYTDPGLEPRMERVYPTPWTRCDREADYRQAWAEFERRLGKKMPEGTPL